MRIITYTVISFIAALSAWGFLTSWFFAAVITTTFAYPYFFDTLVSTGIDPWTARTLSALFALGTLFALREWGRGSKARAAVIGTLLFVAIFGIARFQTDGFNFDPKTGKNLVNVVRTPDGGKTVPKHWAYDPASGNKTEAATPENVRHIGKPNGSESGDGQELRQLQRILRSQNP